MRDAVTALVEAGFQVVLRGFHGWPNALLHRWAKGWSGMVSQCARRLISRSAQAHLNHLVGEVEPRVEHVFLPLERAVRPLLLGAQATDAGAACASTPRARVW